MKAFITPAYTFTPGLSEVGTIALTGIADFNIKRLIAIINQSSGRIVYSTGSPSAKLSSVSGNIVTLFADTSEMNSDDILQIVYEMPDSFSTIDKQNETIAAIDFLASEETLLALEGKFASLGQKASSGSVPVVLSTTQQTILQDIKDFLATVSTNTGVSNSNTGTKAGTITSAAVTVGTSAVRATVSNAAPNASRKKLFIQPDSANSGRIFIGPAGVTTANGVEIIGPDRLEFDMDAGDYYLISDVAGQSVRVLEKV